MIESKFNTPSKFTGEIMGTKVAVEYNHSTIDFDEVIDAFNTIMTGLGYHPDAIKEWIVDRAAEYNEGDIQIEDNEWDVTLEDGLEDESPWPINGDPIQNIFDILKGMEIDGEMLLTDSEFIESCNEVMHDSLTDTLGDLLDKEAIEMSVGEDGEIYYSANPDFDIDNLLK